MITLCNLSVSRGGRPILSGVDATVNSGDFVMLVGTNGSGKTTLLDAIAGRIRLNAGSIMFDGVDVSQLSERRRARVVSRLFQNPAMNVVSGLTVRQNLLLAAKKYERMALRIPRIDLPDWIVEQLGLFGVDFNAILDRAMSNLSGGQCQMIALAMATLCRPRILLLDEPTAALDPTAATQLLCFAHKLARMHGLTVLMVTHDQQLAITLGNALWVITNGTIMRKYADEKKNLVVGQLIGEVDYRQLKSC